MVRVRKNRFLPFRLPPRRATNPKLNEDLVNDVHRVSPLLQRFGRGSRIGRGLALCPCTGSDRRILPEPGTPHDEREAYGGEHDRDEEFGDELTGDEAECHERSGEFFGNWNTRVRFDFRGWGDVNNIDFFSYPRDHDRSLLCHFQLSLFLERKKERKKKGKNRC